jgi:hypothetical protein
LSSQQSGRTELLEIVEATVYKLFILRLQLLLHTLWLDIKNPDSFANMLPVYGAPASLKQATKVI